MIIELKKFDNELVKDLIKEGFDSGLLSLICVYDLTNNDVKKIIYYINDIYLLTMTWDIKAVKLTVKEKP